MTAIYAFGSAAAGTVLMSRRPCILTRIAGPCLFAVAHLPLSRIHLLRCP